MEDVIYRQSTQYRFFTFTPSSLSSLRAATNAHAAQQLLLELGSSASPELMLTPIEELKLVTYYLTTLFALCDHFKTGSAVKATAMTFLSRLYLRISPLQIHPKTLLLPILFLAFKSETGIQSTTWFIKTAAEVNLITTKEELLAPEINIAMNLRWSFQVLHPYRGIEGVKAELLVRGELPKERVERSCAKARSLLTGGGLFTDCYFLYTPGQITMAGLWAVDAEMCEGYLRSKMPAGEEKVLEKLLRVVRECAQWHLLAKTEDGNNYPGLLLRLPQNGVFMDAEVPAELKKEAVRIDRKLQLLRKPLNGKVKHQATDAAEEERRAKKRKLEQDKMDLDDVFGGGSIIPKK
ncbi:Similar to Cyclin CCL1; acc. no. P37366 [Pyronema omphalodes CBS 100304]|uniref:Similar to Cyclin CCL1 acc. no. P37366 n=1 Tax=Pyronema omphalodes (strain CBS 100304) TaxID=1076935 RepID=U4LRJ8_PYROM|nr:Similar to Cyclin CCL1; acc. no. P37366 [Pyronema omphalodes CBS 100304]